MVLDQFQTTYRKDYLWPYVRAYGLKTSPPSQTQDSICKCQCPLNEEKSYQPDSVELAWSRLGPMGPLLDPKVYPARVSATPESQISRFNQPNVFLEKLKEKYPYIYECLRTAPPDDLVSRINRDRLRSTYQVDFCNMQEYPSAPYDELLRAAGVDGMPPCSEPIKLPGDPCRPLQKPIAFRPALISKAVGGGKGGVIIGLGRGDESTCVGTCRGPFGSVTPGATEYQDAIGRLGQMIIRDRIHHEIKKK